MAKPSIKDLIGQKTKQSLTSSYISTEQIKQQISILDEFRDFIPALTPDEFLLLEDNIIKNGCKDALILWETAASVIGSDESNANLPVYILVDGHNRYQICKKHNIGFNVKVLSFASIKEVKDFMIDIQLGRRNLTPQQVSYFRGIRYNLEKSERGRYDRAGHKSQNGTYESEKSEDHKSQNGTYDTPPLSTSEKLAKEYKVGRNTIMRDAEFAAGLDQLHPVLRKRVLSGELKIGKAEVQKLAKSSLPAPIESVEALNELLGNQQVENEEEKDSSANEQLHKLKNQLQKACNKVIETPKPTLKDLERLADIINNFKKQL
jgi:hypothetical protein